jgi:hypothetical protein
MMTCYRWGILAFLLASLLWLTQANLVGAQGMTWPIRALWYTSERPLGYASAALPTDLQTLQQRLCPTHILFTVHVYQTTRTSEDPHIDPDRTVPDTALKRAISEAQRLGLKVVLLPVLFVDDGSWGGTIAPADVSEWFARWREIIRHYAGLAQETKADVLLIGAELITMQKYSSEWERLIREVRSLFRGQISYSANWWFDRLGFENVLNMRQWALLDYLGITAYFELTNKKDPTVTELRAAWQRDRHGQNVLSDLDVLRQRYNKPIVFWEFGYQSRDGTSIHPWDYTQRTPVDNQEQADAYQAFFEIFLGRTGFSGYGLFVHQIGLPRDAFGYDVLDKQAEILISRSHCGRF